MEYGGLTRGRELNEFSLLTNINCYSLRLQVYIGQKQPESIKGGFNERHIDVESSYLPNG